MEKKVCVVDSTQLDYIFLVQVKKLYYIKTA